MTEREHLKPTDIISIVAMVILAVLYAITRESDLKIALMGLILFQGGRLSVKRNGIARGDESE